MITLDPRQEAGQPLYWQIYAQFRRDIASGVLSAREKLPSKRALAASLGVSVTTVDAAYAQLACEGFIESSPKRGFYVCTLGVLKARPPKAESPRAAAVPAPSLRVDFSAGAVDPQSFPYNTWRKLLKSAFNEYDAQLLHRTPPQGDPDLRAAIADYLYRARGVHCAPEQVVIGAGTNHLLLVLGFILGNSFSIALENPVYSQAYQLFSRMGHPVLPVDIDTAGVQVEPLQGREHIAVYVTPSHQFPLGISMPISRRIQLLHWAEAGQARYIIEDDYDSEFRYITRPLPSLQSIDSRDRVIYLGTFTKSIAPSLRISFLVLPPNLLDRYQDAYGIFGSPVSRLEQRVLCAFLEEGYFERHVNKMRVVYRNKRSFLEKCLRAAFGDRLAIQGENAGHHLLLAPHNGMDEASLCAAAHAQGVGVYPISPYFIGKMPPCYQGNVLLGYGGLSEEQIQLGVKLLQSAWFPSPQA